MNNLNLIFRHLEENLDDWLTEELDNYMDDDYLVFDCPGLHHSLVCVCMFKIQRQIPIIQLQFVEDEDILKKYAYIVPYFPYYFDFQFLDSRPPVSF